MTAVASEQQIPKSRRPFRLGVLTSMPAFVGDKVYATSAFGRLMDALSDGVEEFHLAINPQPDRNRFADHALSVPMNRVLRLPWLPSIRAGLFQHRAVLEVARALEARCDVVLVQLPFVTPTVLLSLRRPRVLQFTADVVGVVNASKFYVGPRRLAALTAARAVELIQRRAAHRVGSRVITNGAELYEKNGRPPGRFAVSTSLQRAEVGSVSRRRPQGAPFRVLFVGFLRPEKGMDVLLEAFEQVLARIPTAQLQIVGTQDLVEGGAVKELMESVERLKQKAHIELAGHLDFGPALFQAYADADVLVLPSRSEGTPRVLIEARAFGTVVVASRVGGIPTSVDHGVDGLLVPVGDAGALAKALLSVAFDSVLRERLQRGGLARAHATTVESFASAMLDEASAALGGSS